MIDLHTHTLFSDGGLLPSELVCRAENIGYEAIALTDHADSSNLDWVIPRMIRVCRDLNRHRRIRAIPGVELTHLPPEMIASMVKEARSLGALIVVVHGETIVEPVPPGTNREAIGAGADILAHPGLITEEEVLLAKAKNVLLEISARKGHSLSNGRVARLAMKIGAPLLLNTDTHTPDNLINREQAVKVVMGAGLEAEDLGRMQENSRGLLSRL
jgi:putative hydrolase